MTPGNKWTDIALGAAGILQAATLVEQLARTGFVPTDAYTVSVNSLFDLNPPSAIAVYGEVANLRLGLEALRTFLLSSRHLQSDTMRYVAGILHLQSRLAKQPDMLAVIASRLQQAAEQARLFGPVHDNVIANLGDLYSNTISRFRFRIQVNGDPAYLQQQRIANQVRALLLAAIRAATLWRQLGGNRMQILLQRKRLLTATESLLREIG